MVVAVAFECCSVEEFSGGVGGVAGWCGCYDAVVHTHGCVCLTLSLSMQISAMETPLWHSAQTHVNAQLEEAPRQCAGIM